MQTVGRSVLVSMCYIGIYTMNVMKQPKKEKGWEKYKQTTQNHELKRLHQKPFGRWLWMP